MTNVATNLLGEIVEFSSNDSNLYDRAIVRAVGHDDHRILLVVETVERVDYGRVGELRSLDLSYHRVRPVKRCARCWVWDTPSYMVREGLVEDPIAGIERADLSGWAHRPGKGCRSTESP